MPGADRLIIPGYVLKRAHQRHFTKQQMVATALAPHDTLAANPNAKSGAQRVKHLRNFGGRRLCIVVEYRGQTRIVVTGYWKA